MGNGDSYVLDSFALIGYLENEPFAQEIEDLLYRAKNNISRSIYMPFTLERYTILPFENRGRIWRIWPIPESRAFR